MKLPTDKELLEYIYEKYYSDFLNFNFEDRIKNNRKTKNYVPISVELIGEHFKIDKDIVFGRLYSHLNRKYGYRNYDKSLTLFFTTLGEGENINKDCINFSLLSSVLPALNEEHNRFWTTTMIAFYATLVAGLSILIALFIN